LQKQFYQEIYEQKQVKELRVDFGRGGFVPGPKKCPKHDLGQKNQPCLCKSYTEPGLQDDSNIKASVQGANSDDMELEELSSVGGLGGSTTSSIEGYSIPLGANPPFNKKKKRKNK